MNYVDPLGLNWYRNQETGEVHWQEGDGDLKDHDNLGSTYTISGIYGTIYHVQNEVVAYEEHANPLLLQPNINHSMSDFNASSTYGDATSLLTGSLGILTTTVEHEAKGILLSSKFYSSSSKLFTQSLADKARIAGRTFAGVSIGANAINYVGQSLDEQDNLIYAGHYATAKTTAEIGVNIYGVSGGVWGAAAVAGWEFGRLITKSPHYQKVVHPKVGGNDGLISTKN